MSIALVIVVATLLLSILLVLFIVSVGVREPRAGRKQREAGDRVRAGESEAQHRRSQSRQAGVKAVHLEANSKAGSDASGGGDERYSDSPTASRASSGLK
jgi:hypothetical protein